jgi:hypothetical protein
MSARILVVLLLAVLLLVGGAVVYVRSTAPSAVAEDCGDKPPPKDEFTMAAECEAGEAPAPAGGSH